MNIRCISSCISELTQFQIIFHHFAVTRGEDYIYQGFLKLLFRLARIDASVDLAAPSPHLTLTISKVQLEQTGTYQCSVLRSVYGSTDWEFCLYNPVLDYVHPVNRDGN